MLFPAKLRIKLRILAIAASLAAFPVTGHAGGTPEPRTADAVLAADNAWGAAEAKGDGTFVSGLLMPPYQSVGPQGKVTDAATIVANTNARGDDPVFAAKVAAWKAAHPSRGEVVIDGDTAIVRWVVTLPTGVDAVSSCDVFIYRSGRWRALYSQHTAASD